VEIAAGYLLMTTSELEFTMFMAAKPLEGLYENTIQMPEYQMWSRRRVRNYPA
jgi:hypothetical protein